MNDPARQNVDIRKLYNDCRQLSGQPILVGGRPVGIVQSVDGNVLHCDLWFNHLEYEMILDDTILCNVVLANSFNEHIIIKL